MISLFATFALSPCLVSFLFGVFVESSDRRPGTLSTPPWSHPAIPGRLLFNANTAEHASMASECLSSNTSTSAWTRLLCCHLWSFSTCRIPSMYVPVLWQFSCPILMEKQWKTWKANHFLGEQISDNPHFFTSKNTSMLATGASRARCHGAERSGPTAPTWGEKSSHRN